MSKAALVEGNLAVVSQHLQPEFLSQTLVRFAEKLRQTAPRQKELIHQHEREQGGMQHGGKDC